MTDDALGTEGSMGAAGTAAGDRPEAAGRAGGGRSYVRVVRPGGSGRGGDGVIPPMPVAPPSVLPPWLLADGTPAAGGGGQDGPVDPELSPGEAELRELLHRSVAGLEPAADSLAVLRRAVPLRRARRRRCGGVATAVVLGVLGGLALHSLADAGGPAQGSVSGPGYQNAATASTTPGGRSGPSSTSVVPYQPPPTGAGPGWSTATGTGAVASPGSASGSRSGSAAPWTPTSSTTDTGTGGGAPAAECTRAQLGSGAATLGTPGAGGTTYGSFQVANVSGATCQVSMTGTVSVASVSGTVASRITVVQHSATDPATQLPYPAATPSPVLLAPGQSYVVDFAWVPAGGADAPVCAGGSASAPVSTTSSPGSGPTAAATGPAAADQGVPPATSPPPPGEPTVTLADTPGAGSPPAASTVLPDACSGTVYDTVPLATG